MKSCTLYQNTHKNQDINTQEGNVACLPELTPALYHNFINCSWSLWYSEQCTNCEARRHISWAKCAKRNILLKIHQVTMYPVFFFLLKQKYFENPSSNNWELKCSYLFQNTHDNYCRSLFYKYRQKHVYFKKQLKLMQHCSLCGFLSSVMI